MLLKTVESASSEIFICFTFLFACILFHAIFRCCITVLFFLDNHIYMGSWVPDNCSIDTNTYRGHLLDNWFRSLLVQLGPPSRSCHFHYCAHKYTHMCTHSFHITQTHLLLPPRLFVVSLHKAPVYKVVSQHLLRSRLPEGPASAGPIITVLYLSGSFWAE